MKEEEVRELRDLIYFQSPLSQTSARVLADTLIRKGYHRQSDGEWKMDKIGDGEKVRTCSNCHISQTVNVYNGKVMFNYCPYCGAKMKGGK